MIEINIPGRGSYTFQHLVLDLNGTVALDGEIIEGVEERLQVLGGQLDITVVTADTYGSAQRLGEALKIIVYKIDSGKEDAQKLALVQHMGKEGTICIGNGSNDVSMLKEAALGICIAGQEGASIEATANADLLITDINSALDLLLKPNRLVATLRK